MTITARGRYSTLGLYFAADRTADQVVEAVSYRPPTGIVEAGQSNTVITNTGTPTTTYRWRDGDRMDTLAFTIYGDSRLYWRIMNLNPTLPDPADIEPGTLIKVPRV